MRYRTLSAFILFFAAAFTLVGCDRKESAPPKENEEAAAASEQVSTDDPLDVASTETPEGVTHHFFDAFFSGQDDEARSYLTTDAQTATQETFEAQASDTIRWNVTKVDRDGDNAYVFLKVSDLDDEGDMASEEMIFALRNEREKWRIAGFSAGDMIVNFEAKVIEAVGANSPDEAEPTRVSQKTETATMKK